MSRRPGPINHGTIGGGVTHYKRGEKPCEDCARALRTYQRAAREDRSLGGVQLRLRPGRKPAPPKPTPERLARLLDVHGVGAAIARGIRESA
jgi:hypothetical protein